MSSCEASAKLTKCLNMKKSFFSKSGLGLCFLPFIRLMIACSRHFGNVHEFFMRAHYSAIVFIFTSAALTGYYVLFSTSLSNATSPANATSPGYRTLFVWSTENNHAVSLTFLENNDTSTINK